MIPETDYVSLFDYLGYAAGNKLGQQVFEYSKKKNIKPMTKHVNNGTYSGKVMCYPPSFLHSYFIARESWAKNNKLWEEVKKYFE